MNLKWVDDMVEYLSDPEEFPTIQQAQRHAKVIYDQVVRSNESALIIEKWRIVCTMIGAIAQPVQGLSCPHKYRLQGTP